MKQISVFLENRFGQLEELVGELADNGVDLKAISIAETTGYGIIRLVVGDVGKAVDVLKNDGFAISVNDITVIAVPDRTGGLHDLLGAIRENGIEIEYMYSILTHSESSKAYMAFRFKDGDEAKLPSLFERYGAVAILPAQLGCV